MLLYEFLQPDEEVATEMQVDQQVKELNPIKSVSDAASHQSESIADRHDAERSAASEALCSQMRRYSDQNQAEIAIIDM